MNGRPVDLSRFESTTRKLLNADSLESTYRIAGEWSRELAGVRRQAGLRPVRVNGSRAAGLKMGWFETTLRDGTIGYFQRRTDDCVQASLATLIQMPPHLVPDARLDQQRAEGATLADVGPRFDRQLSEWSDSLGFNIVVHDEPPTTAARWIGMVAAGGDFNDHCLVMTGTSCLWDTTRLMPPLNHESMPMFPVEDISYGITVEQKG